MRQSPVDRKLLIAQKTIIAALILWLMENELKGLCQTLVEAALAIVYRLGINRLASGLIRGRLGFLGGFGFKINFILIMDFVLGVQFFVFLVLVKHYQY